MKNVLRLVDALNLSGDERCTWSPSGECCEVRLQQIKLLPIHHIPALKADLEIHQMSSNPYAPHVYLPSCRAAGQSYSIEQLRKSPLK